MKRFLALMMSVTIAMSLAACGGDKATPASSETQQVEEAEATEEAIEEGESEFTPEQQALAQDFLSMAEEFDAVVDKINANPELLSDEELVTAMNELADEIIKADDYFADPETLTPEVMGALTVAIEVGRAFIAEASAALDELDQ
ncbi:MAG: hypothetical protein ACOX85_11025 [Candidatus Pararuminococcus gallinarum]